MKNVSRALIAVPLAVFSGVAVAHGGGVHAMGTVKSVSAELIVVDTAHGDKTFAVTRATEVLKGNAAAKLDQVRPGDRVVVHGDLAGDRLEAEQVRFSDSQPRRPGQ